VWQQGLAGKAALERAIQDRQIAIQEAQAKKESASLLAAAEVERSRGVAEANKIIGDSLRGNEGYLRYLWIEGLKTNEMQVVYIPTEAGLPILEAGKRP
jgi:regulator of protease activity HflC (stomatin/prohibitin superfamily)